MKCFVRMNRVLQKQVDILISKHQVLHIRIIPCIIIIYGVMISSTVLNTKYTSNESGLHN